MASHLEIRQLRDELLRRDAEVVAWERLLRTNRDSIDHLEHLRHALSRDAADLPVYWWGEAELDAPAR